MKKNQPLNIQRRQLLAQLPHYVAAGAATYIGLNGGLGAQIAGASEQSLTLVPASGSLPDLTLMSDTGEKRLSALAEHNLVINFWATWCPPGIHELPSLMRLDQRLRQQNMAVLLISVDRAGIDKAQPFLEKLGIAGTELGFDPRGDLAKAVGVKALPTSFCINADGIMTAQIVGDVAWDQPAVIETILPYLSA